MDERDERYKEKIQDMMANHLRDKLEYANSAFEVSEILELIHSNYNIGNLKKKHYYWLKEIGCKRILELTNKNKEES